MSGTLVHDANVIKGGGAAQPVLGNPPGGRQSPLPPGTAQEILVWLRRLNDVITDLQKAQSAGINVSSYLVRAQNAFATLQRIYQAYYGQIPH